MKRFAYSSREERQAIQKLKKAGWDLLPERNGQGHAVVTWPATGETLPVPRGFGHGHGFRQRFERQAEEIQSRQVSRAVTKRTVTVWK